MTDTATEIDDAWLEPTWFIDSDAPAVAEFAGAAAGAAAEPTAIAVALFHAVRDGFRYDPYGISYDPAAFRASTTVHSTAGWCVTKSILLTASARHLGIPARLGFADVRNHLTSEKLSAQMGTDLFVWHGYSELLLPDPDGAARDRRWFKLSTAFNIELCERFGVKVLEFDGTADALMHPFDQAGNRHMEYVNERGSFDDLPIDQMLADFRAIYGGAFDDTESATRATATNAAAAGDDAFA
jgi:transglutaminase-like putative cysteine protease